MKRALVTGGSGAIGAAICRKLGADGLYVYVHANTAIARAEEVARAIVEAGGAASAISFDVANADATASAIRAMNAEGVIQIVVNNAGIHSDAVMAGMRHVQWANVLDVTLNGFFNVTQPLLMPMIGKRWGRIINVSSVSGLVGNRGQVNYSTAKSGLHGATKSLSLELASRGITVNAIAPGIIASPMSEPVFDKRAIDQLVPMRRAGTPAEVAELASFLASDRAAYISGQIISINGGMI
ncbi:MAG: short-chain dehydrogenase/reductase [Rhodospirillales bacterium]|nr:short-chain dehydrogenase/reductase [Rhodospirillales bacterium]